ncbi:hypothetical protein [Pseudobacteriovorax antillogorgiicola]|uniref:Uncharacterized protein n=1 Tax=Pseudobacteriovorax antillogorgiicola TaxID=1513793 RepID=A0A1Y6C092_9BACT|nr:hypothetical protein [Pseudobacteriovorax antillogorgiicola]TCS43382.1 hypothetical protein EDD56_13722 [Pseudobacteriovorax antillogorgiicola]SMF34960.1 hypothetical protein SAMN06296036_110186 [Pseudobacteriovorax antillogorgiicola]
MFHRIVLGLLLVSTAGYSANTVGGGGFSRHVESRIHVPEDDYLRTKLRLSIPGQETVDLPLKDESGQLTDKLLRVKKLNSDIMTVDETILILEKK